MTYLFENKTMAEIKASACLAYYYALLIIKGRWEQGEEAIATHEYYSLYYAKYVLEKPFVAGEEILRHSEYWSQYLACWQNNTESWIKYGF